MSQSLLTQRFKELLNLKYRGKLRGFTTDLKIPHSAFYEKYKRGDVILEQYMIDRIAHRWPDIDIDYLQKGTGSLVKYSDKVKNITANDSKQSYNPMYITQIQQEVILAKDEVILIQKSMIERTEQLANCKDDIIKRDAEIKKVLYEFNTYLKDSASAR